MSDVLEFIEHLSDKPWSMYTKADYSIEQWHAACLIHQHDGAPTSKSQCKIPIKTPNGAVNKNGVMSAAAALAGARGGVNASPEDKASAAKVLIRYYREMGKEPPPSLLKHSDIDNFLEHYGVDIFLEHYGKKGMHWGSRSSKPPMKTSSEHKKVAEIKKKKTPQLTNKQIKTANERMNLEQNFNRMNPSIKRRGQMKVKAILTTIGVGGGAIGLYNTLNSPAGKASINAGKKVLAKQAAKKAAKVAAKNAAKVGQLTLF